MFMTMTCALAALFGSWTTTVDRSAAVDAPVLTEAEKFSAAVVERIDAGWRLGAIDVIDDGSELHLEVIVARRARAERLSLSFDHRGETPIAFRRATAKGPAKRRTYTNASELIGTLRRGSLAGLTAECGNYYAEGAGGGASVDPDDYYTVHGSARGDAAAAFLRNAIASAIDNDLALAGVVPHARGYDLVFLDATEEIVHVELDDQNRVVAAEVRWSPTAYHAWATTYSAVGSLGRELAAHKRIDGLRELRDDAGGEPRFELSFDGGAATYVIDVADFRMDDDMEDFGCGC